MDITLGKILSYLVGLSLIGLSLILLLLTQVALIPLVLGIFVLPVVRRRMEMDVGVEVSSGAAAAFAVIGCVALVGALYAAVPADAGTGGASSGSPAASATPTSTGPGAGVSDVAVTTADAAPNESKTALNVTWNARAQPAVDPDPGDMSTYNANDGEKYLVVRMAIENTGDSELDLRQSLFRFANDGVIYDHQALFGAGNSLSDVTLAPDGSYSGWVAFSIPADTTSGELQVDQDAVYPGSVAVTFEKDSSMPINMSA